MLITLALLAVCNTQGAAESAPADSFRGKVAGGYGRLASAAAKYGSVRIIVKADMPFRPLGELSKSGADSEIDAIARMQDKLIGRLASTEGVVSLHKYRYIPYIAMTVGYSALNDVLSLAEVHSVAPDELLSPTAVNWNVAAVGAQTIWQYGYDGSGYTVAILDTGVDKTHPMLSGKVVSEACYSTTDPAFWASSICPGGVAESTSSGSAMPYAGICPSGLCSHGTPVAGVAAGYNTGKSSGVATGATVIAIQVFTRFDSGCSNAASCLLAYNSDVIKGMERVYELRGTYAIAAVNLSTAGGNFNTYCDAEDSATKAMADNLRSAGIATVAASGNNGYTTGISAPACISSVISVGGSTDADTVAYFSNTSSYLSLLAPGYSILSSMPNNGYETWNGTSMAAPHVTGAWAVLKQARPGASVNDIHYALLSTGVSVA
ncbi:MAG: S8 family serine peptidase, partial [Nitrospirae bacterium]|nr:S8 family serine peptidase [Nitrospirota bacterium]